MTVKELLQTIEFIRVPQSALPVEETSANELLPMCKPGAHVVQEAIPEATKNVFKLAVAKNASFVDAKIAAGAPEGKQWAFLRFDSDHSGELVVSHPALLFAYTSQFFDRWQDMPVADLKEGRYFEAAFRWHRPLYDYLLTQVWRTARHFDPEEHIRELARAGYTHLEVNGLAAIVPFETTVPGEFYAPFYAYCAALDQFVDSDLNRGIYPIDYLTANLNLLKKYAGLGRKYGLEPGLLCFEPRTVPEKLFEKYPTLRGARVDHPFRSRKPRYTLSIAHPKVQKHYQDMIRKLLAEVPDLTYMSIWSNDSGAGFEYTSSLYVGRNGGPYLIREWRTHEQIAEVAGKNIVHFMQLLQEAAAETNPEFRVTLRLEPFKVEHDVIMEHLRKKLDVEVPSLLVRGYDLPYHHEKYRDIAGVAGSIHHLHLDRQEKKVLRRYEKKGQTAHMIYSQGNGFNMEPLLGIAFPWLVWEKLQSMRESGITHAANLGGFTPSRLAPYHVNQEASRAFMLDPDADIDAVVRAAAQKWAGEAAAKDLLDLWKKVNDAIHWMPPLPLYSNFGFVWLRTWVRPIIPDLQAVPEAERHYYEDFMVSTDNNTNLVDLGRDVLFDLITQEYGDKYVRRVDKHVLPMLQEAVELAEKQAQDQQVAANARAVFRDQYDRLRALLCWVTTQRSTAAWVAGVYGYLGTDDPDHREKWRAYLDEMMDREIQSTRDLLRLWQNSEMDFMVVSEAGETSYIYGENFGELLQRKIDLMEKYRHVEPRIDPDIMWKV